MNVAIDKSSRIPIYDQIKEQVKGNIHAGRLHTGDQLPTIRELAVELSVNFNTVALAYRDLANEGVIITERGKGTFVASTPGEEQMHEIRREMLNGLVNNLLHESERLGYAPEEVWKTLAEQMKKRYGKTEKPSNEHP